MRSGSLGSVVELDFTDSTDHHVLWHVPETTQTRESFQGVEVIRASRKTPSLTTTSQIISVSRKRAAEVYCKHIEGSCRGPEGRELSFLDLSPLGRCGPDSPTCSLGYADHVRNDPSTTESFQDFGYKREKR